MKQLYDYHFKQKTIAISFGVNLFLIGLNKKAQLLNYIHNYLNNNKMGAKDDGDVKTYKVLI